MHNPFFILFSYPQCLAFSFPPFFFLRFSPLCKKHLRRDQNRDPKKGFPTSVGGAKNEEVWNAPQIWWVGWFGTFSPDRGLGSAVGLAKHYPDLIWAYEFFPFFACLFNKLLRSGFWKQDGIDALSLSLYIYIYVTWCAAWFLCLPHKSPDDFFSKTVPWIHKFGGPTPSLVQASQCLVLFRKFSNEATKKTLELSFIIFKPRSILFNYLQLRIIV